MVPFLVVIAEILFLFLLSSRVKQYLYTLLHALTRSRTVAIAGLSILLYPGVVIHEMSHLVVALILFVKVKHLVLYPRVEDGRVRSGSVTTEKCDILRRTIIGIAPLFSGLALVYVLSISLFPDLQANNLLTLLSNFEFQVGSFVLAYLIFSVSASMYSSRKDLQSMIVVVPVLLLIFGLLYMVGFQIGSVAGYVDEAGWLFERLARVLLIPIVLHACLFLLLQLTSRLIVRA